MRSCALFLTALGVALGAVVGCGSATSAPASGAADAGVETPPDEPPPSPPPKPRYGLQPGDIAPNIRLAGYREDGTTLSMFSLSELADADGSKGIHAIVLTLGALSCPDCIREGRALSDDYAQLYRARGARFVSLLGPDLQADPVAIHSLDTWRKVAVRSYTVLSDDLWEFVGGAPQFPYTIVIDPRSMKVVDDLTLIDPANRACATGADCCQGLTTVDEYGPLCAEPYQCAAWGLCVASYNALNPDSSLIPALDRLLYLNGAPPGP